MGVNIVFDRSFSFYRTLQIVLGKFIVTLIGSRTIMNTPGPYAVISHFIKVVENIFDQKTFGEAPPKLDESDYGYESPSLFCSPPMAVTHATRLKIL